MALLRRSPLAGPISEFAKVTDGSQTDSGKMFKLLRKFQNIFTRPVEISSDLLVSERLLYELNH